MTLRLGVNIDHVATIRNARGGMHPDPLRAAEIAVKAGADGITAHLREDRRHISDRDIDVLSQDNPLPLNLEMAATTEMLDIALRHVPHACCIVPEKREELTTEGGLNVVGAFEHLKPFVAQLSAKNIRVSLFVDADEAQIKASHDVGADIVEIHTGAYCDATGEAQARELSAITKAVRYGHSLGLEMHAGHGLTYDTVKPVAALPEIMELNIGHFLVGEAIFVGLEQSIRDMRRLMAEARMVPFK